MATNITSHHRMLSQQIQHHVSSELEKAMKAANHLNKIKKESVSSTGNAVVDGGGDAVNSDKSQSSHHNTDNQKQ
jgi:hypothetical protein